MARARRGGGRFASLLKCLRKKKTSIDPFPRRLAKKCCILEERCALRGDDETGSGRRCERKLRYELGESFHFIY